MTLLDNFVSLFKFWAFRPDLKLFKSLPVRYELDWIRILACGSGFDWIVSKGYISSSAGSSQCILNICNQQWLTPSVGSGQPKGAEGALCDHILIASRQLCSTQCLQNGDNGYNNVINDFVGASKMTQVY